MSIFIETTYGDVKWTALVLDKVQWQDFVKYEVSRICDNRKYRRVFLKNVNTSDCFGNLGNIGMIILKHNSESSL
jgi:hypothetical protein